MPIATRSMSRGAPVSRLVPAEAPNSDNGTSTVRNKKIIPVKPKPPPPKEESIYEETFNIEDSVIEDNKKKFKREFLKFANLFRDSRSNLKQQIDKGMALCEKIENQREELLTKGTEAYKLYNEEGKKNPSAALCKTPMWRKKKLATRFRKKNSPVSPVSSAKSIKTPKPIRVIAKPSYYKSPIRTRSKVKKTTNEMPITLESNEELPEPKKKVPKPKKLNLKKAAKSDKESECGTESDATSTATDDQPLTPKLHTSKGDAKKAAKKAEKKRKFVSKEANDSIQYENNDPDGFPYQVPKTLDLNFRPPSEPKQAHKKLMLSKPAVEEFDEAKRKLLTIESETNEVPKKKIEVEKPQAPKAKALERTVEVKPVEVKEGNKKKSEEKKPEVPPPQSEEKKDDENEVFEEDPDLFDITEDEETPECIPIVKEKKRSKSLHSLSSIETLSPDINDASKRGTEPITVVKKDQCPSRIIFPETVEVNATLVKENKNEKAEEDKSKDQEKSKEVLGNSKEQVELEQQREREREVETEINSNSTFVVTNASNSTFVVGKNQMDFGTTFQIDSTESHEPDDLPNPFGNTFIKPSAKVEENAVVDAGKEELLFELTDDEDSPIGKMQNKHPGFVQPAKPQPPSSSGKNINKASSSSTTSISSMSSAGSKTGSAFKVPSTLRIVPSSQAKLDIADHKIEELKKKEEEASKRRQEQLDLTKAKIQMKNAQWQQKTLAQKEVEIKKAEDNKKALKAFDKLNEEKKVASTTKPIQPPRIVNPIKVLPDRFVQPQPPVPKIKLVSAQPQFKLATIMAKMKPPTVKQDHSKPFAPSNEPGQTKPLHFTNPQWNDFGSSKQTTVPNPLWADSPGASHMDQDEDLDGSLLNSTGSVDNYNITTLEEYDEDMNHRESKKIPKWASDSEKLNRELFLQQPLLLNKVAFQVFPRSNMGRLFPRDRV